MYTNESIMALAKDAHLGPLGRAWVRIRTNPDYETMTHDECLVAAFGVVKENQNIRKAQTLKKEAMLPHPCTEVTDFNLTLQPSIKQCQVAHLLTFQWINKGQHLVLHGETGEDKNKFACGFANAAMEKLKKTKCYEVQQLVFDLRIAQQKEQLEGVFEDFIKLDLLLLLNWNLGSLDVLDLFLLLTFLENVALSTSFLITAEKPIVEWDSTVSDPFLGKRLSELLCTNVRELKFKEHYQSSCH